MWVTWDTDDYRMGSHSGGNGRGLLHTDAAGPPLISGPQPLPPLPPLRRSDPAVETDVLPKAPAWSPGWMSLALFAVVWACFAALAVTGTDSPAGDVARLGHILATGAAVVALVFVTLSVAHTQVSGLRPQKVVVGVVVLGLIQGRVAAALASGPSDLWGPAAHVFELIGFAVPLAWVGSQFQRGVRRQRVERHASLTATWVERVRLQAHQTVEAAHRHDVRSMLFVIDGAGRALTDPRAPLPDDDRLAFRTMLTESVARLGSLMDVRSEEIQPFAVDGVARAVVHAERRAGRSVAADLPAGLTAVGRAADVAGVLRTLIAVTARKAATGVRLRGGVRDGAVVVVVEPSGADPHPLLTGSWEEIWAETFKPSLAGDEEAIDLYVAARLLADQGADLWSSTAGRARFAVRLPAPAESDVKDET
ncbi:MAG: hypothetical protein QOE80_2050 [Actinomycetota bacterium]|nr:hypothetical protein [Actinomycetota bacterium]